MCVGVRAKNVAPNNAPSRKFLDPLKRVSGLVSLPLFLKEKEQRHRGVENIPNEGGPKPVFWEGVSREVFPTPPPESLHVFF